jgi:histidinol-phosphate phosphatase family protein
VVEGWPVSVGFDIVVPTIGRPTLGDLLDALGTGRGPRPRQVILVDDRPRPRRPLLEREAPAALAGRVVVVRGAGRGPAAARNVGWRRGGARWVVFLDDDVRPEPDWAARLAGDLAAAAPDVAGVQGRIRVPLAADRRPTDWERNVRGLERARWATADMAYRRGVLAAVGGFDERFRRAYREDADLALRVMAAGWRLATGTRLVEHPARPAGFWVSVRAQAGNADDALMRRRHGRGWRERAGAPCGRRPLHLAVTALALLAVGARLTGRRRAAGAAALGWTAATVEFAWSRIAPGPRTPREIVAMAATSVLIPPAATAHWLRGWARAWLFEMAAATGQASAPGCHARRPVTPPRAVLFDRDGTLVVDVPDNGDPARVEPAAGAARALARLRAAGVPMAVVSNQSGVARGLITPAEVEAVNRRVEELLGPIGPWLYCPHGPEDACRCRKPGSELIERAAAALGVRPEECAVIGDTGADVAAALAAGARTVLVPTPLTRRQEIADAPLVAADLPEALDLLFGPERGRRSCGS